MLVLGSFGLYPIFRRVNAQHIYIYIYHVHEIKERTIHGVIWTLLPTDHVLHFWFETYIL